MQDEFQGEKRHSQEYTYFAILQQQDACKRPRSIDYKEMKKEKKSAALILFRSDSITRLIWQAPTEICPIKTNVQSLPILSFLSNSSPFGINGTVKMEIFPREKLPLTNGSGRAGLLPAPVLCCQQEISVQMPCNQSSEDLQQSRHAYCLAVTSTFHLMTSVINQTAEDRTSSLPLGFKLQHKSISFISGCKSRSILDSMPFHQYYLILPQF